MKKFILLIMVLVLVGCNQDALSYYQKSVKATETIERGKSKIVASVDFDFGSEMDQELAVLIDTINYSSLANFDKSLNNKIVRQYLGLSQLGFDTIYYQQEDEEFIKVPFTGKYIKLDDSLFESEENLYDKPPLSEASLSQIKDLWQNLVQEEDVVNLGNDVIDTPEGEVKVKKFVIKFSQEQVIGFLNESLMIISEDKQFHEMISKYPSYVYINDEIIQLEGMTLSGDDIIEAIGEMVKELRVNTFEYTAYIDVDKYIVESNYDIDLSFNDTVGSLVKGANFNLNYLLYDLHEKIVFEFPVLTEENITTIDQVIESLERMNK